MKNYLLSLLVGISFSTNAQQVVLLELEYVETTSTEKIYNFVVADFVDIVGWQFSMLFESSKMSFKEIRNPILDDMDSQCCFNESEPGVLRTVWLDRDFEVENYSKPTTLFQLVFELYDSEGSTLCLSELPLAYEFIIREGSGQTFLAGFLINDDCHDDFSIFLPTGVEDPKHSNNSLMSSLHLTADGALSFTIEDDEVMRLEVYDVLGHLLTAGTETNFAKGRQVHQTGITLINGVYVIKAVTKHGASSSHFVLSTD